MNYEFSRASRSCTTHAFKPTAHPPFARSCPGSIETRQCDERAVHPDLTKKTRETEVPRASIGGATKAHYPNAKFQIEAGCSKPIAFSRITSWISESEKLAQSLMKSVGSARPSA